MSKNKKALIFIISIIIFIIALIVPAHKTYAQTLEPTEDQKIEFRAVSQRNNNGKKQLIVEVWIRNLDFKGMDLRLHYDTGLINPSDLRTNEIIDVNDALTIPSNFEFTNDFGKYMDMMALSFEEGELRVIYSLLGEDERTGTNEYFETNDLIGDYVHITDPVLVGKFSFQMGEGELTQDAIALKTANTSPTTGIKVNINGTDNYENQSLFEFTIDLSSKDADLLDIVLSTGTEEEYKEYPLTPEFEKDTLEYNLEILEYIDKMNLKIVKSDERSIVKLKIPKRDEEDNLVYDTDGKTIIYEQIEIADLVSEITREITLNKLGEPDTIIEIEVSTEDESIVKTYKVVITRPYGTIVGQVQLGETLRESMEASYGIYTKYIADIKLYDTGEINWDGIVPGDITLEDIENNYETKARTVSDDEGNYTIYIIPGTYDCLIERKGFLANIVKNITINASDEINLGKKILVEGDANRTGIIDLDDVVDIVNNNGSQQGDENYKEQYDYGQKGYVALDDVVSTTSNIYGTVVIEEYNT